MIQYFHFKKLNGQYLITNDLGRYLFLNKDELQSLLRNRVDPTTPFGQAAAKNFFYYDGSAQAFSDQLKPYMRESKSYLFSATSLHIFVVTNCCNMNCIYCQAQTGSIAPTGMMTEAVAKRAVDIALSSPSKYLTFEFQGGEPLLNFPIIKYIVEYANSKQGNKIIDYNIVSNLTLLTDEIIEFIRMYQIGVSTSLDGDTSLHNKNRPYPTGAGTFSDVQCGVRRLRDADITVGAIETTTRYSLSAAKQIVNTYRDMEMTSIFLRPLTPLGRANDRWAEVGYTPAEFIAFYRECFRYLLELNASGYSIREGHASIVLAKILTGRPVNYMELRSPCGAGIGQIAYYYDGNIYTCDEGRMLAEMGNEAFRLGSVFENSYDDLINADACKAACISSILESLPSCSDCVYSPYCGTCPVVNLALYEDIYAKGANDYRCQIYQGIFDTIFSALQNPETAKILQSWV